MSLIYKLNRLCVRIKHNRHDRKVRHTTKTLDKEQLIIFNNIAVLARENRQTIKFDPKDDETYILLDDVLITIKPYKVLTYNTHGFKTTEFPHGAYDLIMEMVQKEAHYERRKLKFEFNQRRVNKFLTSIYIKETTQAPDEGVSEGDDGVNYGNSLE